MVASEREDDGLRAEMRARLAGGASAVVARGGVIVAQEAGRGIGPLLALFDAGALSGAFVCDRVMGRAAAAICVAGGAREAFAERMSEGAAAFLAAHGVTAAAARTVPRIDNRDRSGICPMEQAVQDLDDPAEMIGAIRRKLEELKKKGSMK